ncbi:AlpA family transcriptional regulator [uncultured Thiodictyon sp.]|uniref:helix-turn-helix transcriptional regulator n=1 Tax=uncultured Thiodictyon sp. TaxID=1846217 RepID=UPI0025F8BF38|nr:AlpA family phage regulatory protein [uncultured Thiodictyon sp.]
MAQQAAPAPLKIIRRPAVEDRTGLSRSTIYGKLRQNPKRPAEFDPTFPRPVSISKKAVGWVESEVDAWLAEQVRKSRPDVAPTPKPKARPQYRPAPVAILDSAA